MIEAQQIKGGAIMADEYQGLHIANDAFPFKKRTQWISWRSFESISSNLFNEGGAATFAAGAYFSACASAGVPFPVEAHDLDLFGLSMAAAGDTMHLIWMYPDDLDTADPQLEFAVCFIHESTDADAPIWKVHHLDLAAQQEMKEPVNDATEVVTFAAHTCSTTDESYEQTVWKAATTDPAAADLGSIIAVECDDLGSASANEIRFFKLGIRYKADCLYDHGPAD